QQPDLDEADRASKLARQRAQPSEPVLVLVHVSAHGAGRFHPAQHAPFGTALEIVGWPDAREERADAERGSAGALPRSRLTVGPKRTLHTGGTSSGSSFGGVGGNSP